MASFTYTSLELIIQNLQNVRQEIKSQPIEIAMIYLDALIKNYEEQLKKAI